MNTKTEAEIVALGKAFKSQHAITKWSQKYNAILIAKLAKDAFGMEADAAKAFANSIGHAGLAGNASQFGQKLDEKAEPGKASVDLDDYFN